MAKQAIKESAANLEMLLTILKGTQDQVRFADSKAAFVTGFNSLLFGFIISHADKLIAVPVTARTAPFWIASSLLMLYGVAMATSIGFVIASIISRFGHMAPPCKVHFGHITKHYGKDYARYYRDASGMSDADWAGEVGSQIVEVSHIATTKHQLVSRAALFTIAAFILWVAGFVAMMHVPRP